jgi:hypothetical protein
MKFTRLSKEKGTGGMIFSGGHGQNHPRSDF